MTNIPARQDGKATPFRLLRYFTLISLISIVVTSILLGIWFRTIAVANLVGSEERNNVALAHALSQSIWPEYARFLTAATGMSAAALREHSKIKEIDHYITEQFNGLGILKIKIYDLDGNTVFSTDHSQIGKSEKAHPSFQSASQGKVVSKMSFVYI